MPGRLLIGLLKTKGWGRKMRTKKRGRSIYLRCEGARATATAYSRNVSAAAGRRAVRTWRISAGKNRKDNCARASNSAGCPPNNHTGCARARCCCLKPPNQRSCGTPFRFDRGQKFPASRNFHRQIQQAKIFTDKLSTRIQVIQRDNQQLTVGDFLAFVSDYANEAFDPTTAYRIANRMAQFSTNDPKCCQQRAAKR